MSLTLNLLHSGQMLLRRHSPDVAAACFYSKQHHTHIHSHLSLPALPLLTTFLFCSLVTTFIHSMKTLHRLIKAQHMSFFSATFIEPRSHSRPQTLQGATQDQKRVHKSDKERNCERERQRPQLPQQKFCVSCKVTKHSNDLFL